MTASNWLSRRAMIAGTSAALILPSTLGAAGRRRAGPAIADTDCGRVQGISAANGVLQFKGVPYAADTGGANRFMAPRAVKPWAGVRDATRFGDRCPQGLRPGGPASAATPPFSENCCVLNVYTPDLRRTARRPVMFYIHGGGFRSGNGDDPVLDGSSLARFGDVVVVTINHRLNVLGFAGLGEIAPEFGDAANAGQLDVIAALKWVKRNIESFGGDPHRVMVFGVSGGGSAVETLLVMPEARGLFHRAINMSGSSAFAMKRSDSMAPVAEQFLKNLGIGRGDLRKLQELPTAQLLSAYDAALLQGKAGDYRPTVDGRHILHGPLTAEAMQAQPPVPVMLSRTSNEASAFLGGDKRNWQVTDAQVATRIAAQFGFGQTEAAALMDRYRQEDRARTAWDVLVAVATDALTHKPMLRSAEAKAKAARAPIYLCDFDWRSPKDGGVWGAAHSIDVPFVFGNLDAHRLTSEPDARAIATMKAEMATYVAFARTGSPNNPAIPAWQTFDPQGRASMVIDGGGKLVHDFHRADREAAELLPVQDAFDIVAGPLLRYSA